MVNNIPNSTWIQMIQKHTYLEIARSRMLSPWPSKTRSQFPVRPSHALTFPSKQPVNTSCDAGDHRSFTTPSWNPQRVILVRTHIQEQQREKCNVNFSWTEVRLYTTFEDCTKTKALRYESSQYLCSHLCSPPQPWHNLIVHTSCSQVNRDWSVCKSQIISFPSIPPVAANCNLHR
jgi:hypothetical protein